MEFPFHIYSALAKKGEIKMKSMNLFGNNTPKEDIKPKKKEYSKEFKELAVNLASKIGVTKAAEELGVSTNLIYSWKKTLNTSTLAKNSLAKKLPLTLIQDENGNLIFSLKEKTYSLNINSEEERERVKKEVNTNSLVQYDWFKEETGAHHWVFYNTKMYEIVYDRFSCINYLHYKEDSSLTPIIPLNTTSCYKMFYDCCTLIQLDLSNFDTSNVVNMYCMFSDCKSLTQIDLSNFDTSKVINMRGMFYHCKVLIQLDLSHFDTSKVTNMYCIFCRCEALTQLDISSFNTSQVTNMCYMFSYCSNLASLDLSSFNISKVNDIEEMFYDCKKLTAIYISDKWKTNSVIYSDNMFKKCYSLPNFSQENTDIEMAKPVEEGGYLTLKN